jgi:indolepyruvate ferredoxin oxidoreductase alpha subunit
MMQRSELLLGNEAIARGALEAGVNFATGYPGTPSTEIMETILRVARERGIYAEWSINEKVACEVAAAGAFAGLTSISAMKNAGLSVALDFLTHLSLTGLGAQGGSMVVVVCDDPGAHSSGDETDSRWLARFLYAPLLEPSSVQEAKDVTRWAFHLSRENGCYVMIRSYTRLSHSSGILALDELPPVKDVKASLDAFNCLSPYLALPKHAKIVERLGRIQDLFEHSAFNSYEGPERPELLIVCSGSGYFCAKEAVELLGLEDSVGLLKLVTIWPFPRKFVRNHLQRARSILVVEEVDPVLETLVKETICDDCREMKTIWGKNSGHLPFYGEITPDLVLNALLRIGFGARSPSPCRKPCSEELANLLISRALSWCAGCPHRATFWALERAIRAERRGVYVTGDIGCYTLDVFPEGKCQMKLLHAMGSGLGLASGLGQLRKFGAHQPIVSICGDSTFFHASIPALINAVYNGSNLLHIILDNSATAMTGFQAHPGVGYTALGEKAKKVEIERLCEALDVPVKVVDPFQLRATVKAMRELIRMDNGVRVLVSRRSCELLRMRSEKKKPFHVRVAPERCRGQNCAVCYRDLRCPAMCVDAEGKAWIREDACPGCGYCATICPFKAIIKEETNDE